MVPKTILLNVLVSFFSLLACSTINAAEPTVTRSPIKVSFRGLFSKNEEEQRDILKKAGFENESALTEYLLHLKADNDTELTQLLEAKFPDLIAIDELIVIIEKIQRQSRSPRSPSPEPSSNSGAADDKKIGDATQQKPVDGKLPDPVATQKAGHKPLVKPEETTPKKPAKAANVFKKVAIFSTAVAATSYVTYRYIQEQRSQNGLLNNKIS